VPFVEHYWVTRWDRRGCPPRNAASLLDPCIHLHIQDGRAIVMGAVRGTYRVRIEGVGCVVGVQFRAGGFHAFVPRPAVEWTGRVVPAEVLLGGSATWARALSDATVECAGGAADHAAIVAAHLDAFLGDLQPERDATAERVADLVRDFRATIGVTPGAYVQARA
jgi:hypothetical protein